MIDTLMRNLRRFKMDYKSRFSEFNRPSFFSRVDADHILDWHIGIDEIGRMSIEYRSNFTARRVQGTKYIEVNQYKNDKYCTIRFSLCDKELNDLFFKFCEDMVEKTRGLESASLGYNAVIDRFSLWKKMFFSPRNEILSEEKIMGLIGELLLLKNFLFEKYGVEKAIDGWSGQDCTRKDFSYEDKWYEAKAISFNKDTVSISSLEQLDSNIPGELAVVLLEKMSPSFMGITLNQLIWDVCEFIKAQDAKELFISKIESSGYVYNVAYDSYMFALKNIRRFNVDELFPRLIPSNVPSGVVSAKYEISLLAIKDKEII